jgi:EmrB/QacA subfamily drug resistance transporter
MVGPYRLPCETPEAQPAREGAGPTQWVLPATILGSSLSFIDGSVVNVALPAIQNGLGTELTAIQWVVNGYMLTLASLILLGGAAGDRFGHRRIFLIGLIGFAATSLACGLAPSAVWLIIARLAQGVAGALLVPSSLAIIGAAYSGDARGQAIGTWAAAGALTTALGPPLGGWLVDTVGWRSIFFINLPLAALALWFALKLPAVRAADTDKPLDLRGALLAILGLGLLSYGLIALGGGQVLNGVIALAAAVPAIWLLLKTEAQTDNAMMPLGLFRNETFLGANVLTLLLYAALIGALFLLPFLLIQAHGYSAAAAGSAFLPFSIIMGLGSRRAGGLVEKMDPRLPLIIGPSLTAFGFAILAASGQVQSYWVGVFPGLVIVGIGITLCIAPLTTTVFNSAPSEQSGAASGINNAAARVGGLLAVAALGLAFGGAEASSMQGAALVDAYRVVMLSAAALAALSALTAALTVSPQPKQQTS